MVAIQMCDWEQAYDHFVDDCVVLGLSWLVFSALILLPELGCINVLLLLISSIFHRTSICVLS
jgi:hypothetical protein